jgi:hypothetical protein
VQKAVYKSLFYLQQSQYSHLITPTQQTNLSLTLVSLCQLPLAPKPVAMRSTSFVAFTLCALSTTVFSAPTPQLSNIIGSITNPGAGNDNIFKGIANDNGVCLLPSISHYLHSLTVFSEQERQRQLRGQWQWQQQQGRQRQRGRQWQHYQLPLYLEGASIRRTR